MIQFKSLGDVNAAQADEWLKTLAANLRDADKAEISASCGGTPEDALRTSLHYSSHGWAILDAASIPIAMFGAAPTGTPGVAVMWMMGTEGIRRNAKEIARNTRPYLDEMNRAYPYLWNYVDARNEVSLRWLRWAGCQLVGEEPLYGPQQRLFYAFARTANV